MHSLENPKKSKTMSGNNKISILQKLVFFFHRFFILRRWFHRGSNPNKQKYQKYPSSQGQDLSNHTIIFNVEGSLLKSNSLFPYFMLVAFEAGGVIRSFLLFILYPFITIFMSYEMGLKTMVFLSFFGVKKETFRVGKSVLPKWFLEDVGFEMFEVLKRSGKRIGVSDLPQVMIDGFLSDYLEIEVVIGKEMKMIGGYYLGIMEDQKIEFDELVQEESLSNGHHVIGITSFNSSRSHRSLFSQFCQEIYFVRNSDKKNWQTLPKNQYPKPLIFHDGRLAIKPTPLNTLTLFMWAPFAVFLATARLIAGLSLPYPLANPFLAFSGLHLTLTVNNNDFSHSSDRKKGCLFVCNHRTLLDPLYISYALRKNNLKAVTYSLSRLSELLAPIKTVRLTRDRVKDGQSMERLLNQGDLVVCPEGTTCREPYLLRFSPLFAEISDVIVPVAIDSNVSFFHGTTASGFKALDPIFFLLDPYPSYTVQLLEPVFSTCRDSDKFEVANHVQHEIGNALGFECTNLTRRDKYLILAGNNGVVVNKK